jgi:hypothetical protein
MARMGGDCPAGKPNVRNILFRSDLHSPEHPKLGIFGCQEPGERDGDSSLFGNKMLARYL